MADWVTRHITFDWRWGVGAGLLSAVVGQFLDIPFWGMLLLCFIILMTVQATVLLCSHRVSLAANRCLEEDCDPEPLLALSMEMSNRVRTGAAGCIHRINTAVALTAMGQFEEAEAAMEKAKPLLPEWNGDGVRLYYILDLSAIALETGRIESALHSMEEVPPLLERARLSQKKQEEIQWILAYNQCIVPIFRGEAPPELEEELNRFLTSAKSQNLVVSIHGALGQYYLLAGRLEEAREHLSYAVEHGNKLYARVKAESHLAEIATKELN